MKRRIAAIVTASIILATGPDRGYAEYIFTTLDNPNASFGTTQATGISGDTIVGYFREGTYWRGYKLTGGVYTTVDHPLATMGTVIEGIDGNTVVGWYQDSLGRHGFTETGGVFTSFNEPQVVAPYNWTQAYGKSGNTVVGYYTGIGGYHGFSLTNGVYTTLDHPLAAAYPGTTVTGISGNVIVGSYQDAAGTTHGFSEVGGVYKTLDDPLAYYYTNITAISGSNIVGWYADDNSNGHGFIETAGIYVPLDHPLATFDTMPLGVSGTTVVGTYVNFGSDFTPRALHGFKATLVAPANSTPSSGSAPVPAQLNEPVTITSSTSAQQVTASFGGNSNGTLTVTQGIAAISDLLDPGNPYSAGAIDFIVPIAPAGVQLWDLMYSGGPLTGSVTLVFQYDPLGLSLAEEDALTIFHFVGGQWVDTHGVVDTNANTITLNTTSFSPFALGAEAAPEPGSLSILALGTMGLWRRGRKLNRSGR